MKHTTMQELYAQIFEMKDSHMKEGAEYHMTVTERVIARLKQAWE